MQNVSQDSAVTNMESPVPPSQFRLRVEAIRAAINFKRENDPAFAELSVCDLADKCRVGRSTFKRILSGAATDSNCSTIALICEGLGIDPAVLFGLAPSRDYNREAADYNPTLMDNMRRQNIALEERLVEKRERIKELVTEVSQSEQECDRLRKLYNKKCIDLSAAEARMEAMKAEVDEGAARRARRDETEGQQRRDIEDLQRTLSRERDELRKVRMLCILACLGLIVAMGVVIYLLWEMANPTLGKFRY